MGSRVFSTRACVLSSFLASACLPEAPPDRPRPDVETPAGGAPPESAPLERAGGPLGDKRALLEHLEALTRSGRFQFGLENSLLWGVYDPGSSRLIPTNDWFWQIAAPASRGQRAWTSDSGAVAGVDPALLGVSIDMMIFDPAAWNRHEIIAEAVRHVASQPEGIVAMDWHAPSCTYDVSRSDYAGAIASPLDYVDVDGMNIPIYAAAGGTPFYAEASYTRPIASRADIPENLGCVCRIANDRPIPAGTHAGLSARAWLVAHARYIARFFRSHGLSGLPIIIRPFHEHTGEWFWWGQPYWNCRALLDDPLAISGPDAYRAMYRIFAEALRAEPGMENIALAYSTDKLGRLTDSALTPAQMKIKDPEGLSRDLLRAKLLEEFSNLGASYESPLGRLLETGSGQVSSASREAYYLEAYPGDDLIDVLGIDLYYPYERAASASDLEDMKRFVSSVASIARSKHKPYALTEVGTYRMHLLYRVSRLGPGASLTMYRRPYVDRWLSTLFDPSVRGAFLAHYGLTAAADVVLSPEELSGELPGVGAGPRTEDWYRTQLLELARSTGVAYALGWQTYFGGGSFEDDPVYYYAPFPGHPEAASFRQFSADPAVCFGAGC